MHREETPYHLRLLWRTQSWATRQVRGSRASSSDFDTQLSPVVTDHTLCPFYRPASVPIVVAYLVRKHVVACGLKQSYQPAEVVQATHYQNDCCAVGFDLIEHETFKRPIRSLTSVFTAVII